MKIKFLVIILGLIIVSKITAQDQVSILELDKVKEYLMLNADQYKVINAKVVQIKEILEEDKKIISGLKERIKNDDEPGFFEKIKVKKGRDGRISKIKDLIKKVEKQLNEGQKEKFKNVIKPELQGLRKEEIFGSE